MLKDMKCSIVTTQIECMWRAETTMIGKRMASQAAFMGVAKLIYGVP